MTTPEPDVTARIDSDVRYTPHASGSEGQFAPGTIIAGRYRIASILGSGGMGEVYRADDTKLGQTVALKFLPAKLARDPILLGRLHDEVRLGRVIAHPNVCRLYDIVDWDGAHFVAMEYVDGEDLSRLLRRIGRLAHDKAVDIARGIAAGLMAAHAKGILHRDLKPANVMIDSQGDARIMDFGLALAAGEDDGTISGTPAYMAPELLGGGVATVQSDLYALGLVMYELFTGKRAHNARTLNERVRDITSEIATPSSLIRDIDPAVERIILRCLSNDPAQRPRSAREVIEALPGGDPLAAALAAGETPSPRVVAAAGAEGILKPWVAWTLLAAVLVCLFVTLAGKRQFGVTRVVPIEKTPDVLTERAVTTLRALGIPAQSYQTHAFGADASYISWIHDNDRSARRWERLRGGPASIVFWLIESAQPLPPELPIDAAKRPGTTIANLDTRGRLVSLDVIPMRDWPTRTLDWTPLLAAAGLDATKLTAATPRLVPASPTDARAAWSGRHPDEGTPIHVEAAAWRGTPVFLQITGPWENASASMPFTTVRLAVFITVLVVAVIVIGLLLAWRNARLRRGDRAGALKVAATMFVLTLASELLNADHQPSGLHEVNVLRHALESSLLWAAVMYVLYLALEPVVRRRWPHHLIASGRLLAGNPRDPMVGRDVLIGILAGLAHTILIVMGLWLDGLLGNPPFLLFGKLGILNGARYAMGHIVDALSDGMFGGFLLIVILVAFMLLFRRRLLAAIGLALVAMIGYYLAMGEVTPFHVLMTGMLVYVAARFGLLAIAVSQVVFLWVFQDPLFASGSWQSIHVLPVAVVLVSAVWAFYTSLGGQSPFSASLLDE